MQYLVWSIEHEAWWRPGRIGYTRQLAQAGRYDEEAARRILERANYVKVNECAIPAECVHITAAPARTHTDDDMGFDEEGRPFMIGAEAGARQEAIVDHPDATPVLVVATHNNEVGVRVYGPPSTETADLLDHVAATYHKTLKALGGTKQ